ncbi:DUF559 domain-containing protein [Robertkochia marina]|uniref:DUF559 domain-containing protein n=1 Tax=Robertkochia marina TaxID=1227945 RepID=A0A4S3M022_9FLAO|nr:DUF559 domain-containing protein [Robertkochia marina]THD67760.1 DUF559 domain-containing protein [Robertkochia marina]TRZ40925.1 DUF559 domain-containing protein [Robertkochia marina]
MKSSKDHYYDLEKWKKIHSKSSINFMDLQLSLTETELKLKEILESKPFIKHNFKCKHPVGPYIMDFYSEALKLIIQIDTEYNERRRDVSYEIERNKLFEYNDIKTLSFHEELIITAPNGLRAVLEEMLNPRSSFPL